MAASVFFNRSGISKYCGNYHQNTLTPCFATISVFR